MFIFGHSFIILPFLVLLDLSLTSLTINDNELIVELYKRYMDAVSNDNFTFATRRLFKPNRQYEVHVQKLKEVNGYKKHNLLVKQSLRSGRDPYVYINNPVESKIPNAYLTLEEFKNILTHRVMEQKKEFTVKTTKKILFNKKMLVANSDKITQPTLATERRIKNTPAKVNVQKTTTKRNNINKLINKNVINEKKVLNEVKTTILNKIVPTESITLSTIQEKIVTDSAKVTENITLDSSIIINENYKTEETVTEDINKDTTDPTTENTETQHSSHSESSQFEKINLNTENALSTDISTVFENKLTLQTNNTEISRNEENITTTTSFKIKDKPKRKKITKSISVSTKKRRSTLGRPLVFFGSR